MDVLIAPPSHADVLQLVIQLAVLLGVARLLGELARRVGQPAVVGEILAGVILGPSVLGALTPGLAAVWLPASPVQAQLLETVALIGVMLLMVVTGFETDLGLIRRRAGTAAGVAVGGLLLPFGAGLALGWWFPKDLLGDPDQRLVFALFLATTMAVSAIPVLASILLDLRMMRRDIGQTMLAAGMVNDLVGWAVLGVLIALAEGGGGLGTVGVTVLTVLFFLVVTIVVGPFIVNRTIRFVHKASGTSHRFLTVTLVLVFAWAAFSQALHLEPVIGAFAMGILLGRVRRLPVSVAESLESLALGLFAPIFFAVAGLKVNLVALAEPRLAGLTLAVIAVAIVGKTAGAYAGGRWLAGADHWTSLAYGVGLTARGAIGIVVATVGQSLGIITQDVFSIIVVMAVVTSLFTPPALKATLRRVAPAADEAARLRREEAAAGGLTRRVGRVLVPIRPPRHPGDSLAVKVVLLGRLAGPERLAVTFMSAADGLERAEAEQTVRSAARDIGFRSDVTTRVVPGDPVQGVLDEAAKGYDLVLLGATDVAANLESLFGSVVDDIVRMVSIPTLVVRGSPASAGWQPQRILVPTDGTPASRRAADLAFSLAGPDTTVTVLHVVPSVLSPVVSITDTGPVQRLDVAHEIVSEVRDRGIERGVATATMVELGPEVDEAILQAARQIGADLVVLGTSARTGTRRLYLGPRVERILTGSPCPVAVLNS
ncbi:MAG: cation:proton antiporter [Acidimicrobiia bacterium]|nr:cation:proton antiporter [Acidimicrobiia bacterium]